MSKTQDFLQNVLDAALNHGEQSEPDHEVGDLQSVVWALWGLLTKEQKLAFAENAQMLDLLEQWGSES